MRKFLNRALFILVVLLGLAFYWFYYNVYSDGQRNGTLVKFSRKGDIFKTYEGQILLPGSSPNKAGFNNNYFYFSVDNDSVANILMNAEGKDVTVHYKQYRKSLPWRGFNYNGQNSDNGQYIADKLISVQ